MYLRIYFQGDIFTLLFSQYNGRDQLNAEGSWAMCVMGTEKEVESEDYVDMSVR